MKFNFNIILSVGSLIISLIALYYAFNAQPTPDALTNTVAILTALCTILIAWQIYNVIDFKTYEKRIKDLKVEYDEDVLNLDSSINQSTFISINGVSQIYFILNKSYPENEEIIKNLNFYISQNLTLCALINNLNILKQQVDLFIEFYEFNKDKITYEMKKEASENIDHAIEQAIDKKCNKEIITILTTLNNELRVQQFPYSCS